MEKHSIWDVFSKPVWKVRIIGFTYYLKRYADLMKPPENLDSVCHRDRRNNLQK